ncbi:MAG: (deoxy)nucleoside triphosphate pyrophosphohydrolase [Oscillospiraceae bacterium]|nr:(deoxy)nucleoside triphosphate pyrophosphohydrolase [Oscillospiraceae bacterium]
MIEVVAALIWDDDRFLICQRPEHKARPLLWEFPGGKVEPGESMEKALIRECFEELGIVLAVGSVFNDTVYAYDEITIHLTVLGAVISEGKPQLLEHADLRWIKKSDITFYSFCPADTERTKPMG